MAIPGVGPVVAAGWLASTLAGAAAGAATGGALGALTQAGISDDDAHVYAEGLRRGGAVVSARVADQDAARLQAVMDRSAVRLADRGKRIGSQAGHVSTPLALLTRGTKSNVSVRCTVNDKLIKRGVRRSRAP